MNQVDDYMANTDNKPRIKKLRKRFSERPGGVEWLKGPNKENGYKSGKYNDTSEKTKVLDPEYNKKVNNLEKMTKSLDSILEKVRVPDNILVFRREADEMEDQILKANIGDCFLDRGFAAVTSHRKNIELEQRGYAATVLLEKGTHAVPISPVLEMQGLKDKYPGEYEILIPRSLLWIIVDKDDVNKTVKFRIRPLKKES